jgi:tRNA pseudouridine38-40 synthase
MRRDPWLQHFTRMRIALGLEYDGSRFLGWQTQPGGGTVQDCLEAALATIAGADVAVTCAGRTDRGVHALEQVVHFDVGVTRPESAWVRGVNALLPDSVAVQWSREVPAEFHARYAARARTYRYVLLNRAVRPALAALHAGWFHLPLDVAAMRAGARHFLGEQDFSAFRSAECQATTPVRTLHALEIETRGERIDFVLRANAFLHHMVRNIVGTLVQVGAGKQPPGWVAEVLQSRARARAAPTFAAEGLYLERVEYEPHWNLPRRAQPVLAIPVLP